MTLKDWLEIVDYRIKEGYDFLWDCYGPDSQGLDSYEGSSSDPYSGIVFDRSTNEVYEMIVCDYENNREYKIYGSEEYRKAYENEAAERHLSNSEEKQVILEDWDDFREKARAIMRGESYDTRVVIPVDLDRDSLYEVMLNAHKADLTLNEYINQLLESAIDNLEKS